MGKKLLIVESPTKVKTIQKYLGSDFIIKASVGHIKDLPKSKMGVDIKNNFKPFYVIIPGKKKIIDELRKFASNADIVYLAPDPDREGEAIAWHIAEELDIESSKIKRVLFNEITPKGVKEGLENYNTIDINKFESQQARRILDRLVGYEISPILWKKIKRGLSAGRVQSVALRLLVQREREIEQFIPREYWIIKTELLGKNPPQFTAQLVKIDKAKADVKNSQQAQEIKAQLEKSPFIVKDIIKKEKKKSPQPPFVTSRLQQEASNRFNFTAKRTMQIAQSLYEGVSIGSEGMIGLITYMRTDSTRLSDDAITAVRQFILDNYGEQYVPQKPNLFKNQKSAQEAHEAIRPTSLKYTPQFVKPFLNNDQFKLYKLIWNRFIACQMASAIYYQTTIEISAGKYTLKAIGNVLKFPGWLKVLEDTENFKNNNKNNDDNYELDDTVSLPELKNGETLKLIQIMLDQKFTQPPSRFTEGSLVRDLEEKGIGRPSTYATIISTIQDRGYVLKEEGKLKPTSLGIIVTDKLISHFPDIMDIKFTAQMEDNLDKIEENKISWVELLKSFYPSFHNNVLSAMKNMEIVKEQPIKTDEKCPKCGNMLLLRDNIKGKFLACSNFPKCRYTQQVNKSDTKDGENPDNKELNIQCPKCNSPMILKRGRFGTFIACSKYPECKTTMSAKLGIKCPKDGCDGDIVEKRTKNRRIFYACSNYQKTGCDFVLNQKPVSHPCPSCGAKFIVMANKKGNSYKCIKCNWTGELNQENS